MLGASLYIFLYLLQLLHSECGLFLKDMYLHLQVIICGRDFNSCFH